MIDLGQFIKQENIKVGDVLICQLYDNYFAEVLFIGNSATFLRGKDGSEFHVPFDSRRVWQVLRKG